MIVVDSSVWINQLRQLPTKGTTILRRQLKTRTKTILVGDLALLEVLQGCRSEEEATRTEQFLRLFEMVEMTSLELAAEAARNYRHLRQRGITVRSTIDVMIATFCIEGDHQLLADDRDFSPMAQHLGLRLV